MRVVNDSSQPAYSERVCVKQVTPEAIDLLHKLFGGYRFTAKPSAAKGRELHGWQVTDLKAVAFLQAVRPFLKIKRRQADNCLALRHIKTASKKHRVRKKRGHVGASARSDKHSAEMERLHGIAKSLNRVGA